MRARSGPDRQAPASFHLSTLRSRPKLLWRNRHEIGTRAPLTEPRRFSTPCRGKTVEEIETTAAAPVKIITLAPATLGGIVAATGVVAAAPGADWTITAPEPARILELPKAEGDRVRTGDLLVRFEIPSAATESRHEARGSRAGAGARGKRHLATRWTTRSSTMGSRRRRSSRTPGGS